MSHSTFPSMHWKLSIAALFLLLSACESPVNSLRAQRFGSLASPTTISSEPRALALALQVTPDGHGLTPTSLHEANAMLTSQGRLSAQILTITPFNARGEQLAQRLARALERSGAQSPRVIALPTDAQRLQQAAGAGWDLELQSEALVVRTDNCRIANTETWTIHPYEGIGTLGCANRANLARLTTDPRDLTRPRTLEGADGTAAAAAVARYQSGDIRELIDIDFDEN